MFWKVRATPSAAIRWGGRRFSVWGVPSASVSVMVPGCGRYSPDTQLMTLVFPAPFGPISARSSRAAPPC